MKDKELKTIEERANAATPGPWISPWTKPDGVPDSFGIDDSNHFTNSDGAEVIAVSWYDGPNLACAEPDAAFIAASRSDIPALCAAARERDAMIAALAAEIDRLKKVADAAESWAIAVCGPDIRSTEAAALFDAVRAARGSS